MGTYTNSEDPDEMPHNVAFHCYVKKIFRQKYNIYENYNLSPLDMYNGLSQVILSNQREESISIQRVNNNNALMGWNPSKKNWIKHVYWYMI